MIMVLHKGLGDQRQELEPYGRYSRTEGAGRSDCLSLFCRCSGGHLGPAKILAWTSASFSRLRCTKTRKTIVVCALCITLVAPSFIVQFPIFGCHCHPRFSYTFI
jgi:hypothetical protein